MEEVTAKSGMTSTSEPEKKVCKPIKLNNPDKIPKATQIPPEVANFGLSLF